MTKYFSANVNGIVTEPDSHSASGLIQWSGNLTPWPAKREGNNRGMRYVLRGAVSDPVSGNTVGSVTLSSFLMVDQDGQIVDQPQSASLQITPGLYEALSGDDRFSDYWSSVQNCALVTPSQLQGQIQSASDINNLFKLNNTERQRLLQR